MRGLRRCPAADKVFCAGIGLRPADHAQAEVGKLRNDAALARIGKGPDPYLRGKVVTVEMVLDFYVLADCPKRNSQKRAGVQLKDELRQVANLKRILGPVPSATVTLETLREYARIRSKELARQPRGPGLRTLEVEERCLSAAFRFAARNPIASGVMSNPIAHDRPKHQLPASIRHARDCMPANADELHSLARNLFSSRFSEPLGWQLLLQALTGQRTAEMVAWRMDSSAPYQAGFVDASCLWLTHKRGHKGTFPYCPLTPELSACLAAHRAWHRLRFPQGSPWYFPSVYGSGVRPIKADALTHALRRVCPALGLPYRSSHGLRSYFVNVLRSQGMTDAEIALRIGQKTGGRLIVTVYGEIIPYKLSWGTSVPATAPSGADSRPAWEFCFS